MMKTRSSKLTFLTCALLLAACAPVNQSTPIPLAPTHLPTFTSNQTPTETKPATMPCMVIHAPVTPEAMGAEFEKRGHVTGPTQAAVTIVVFSDYQCPTCAFLENNLKQIRLTHPDDVRIVFVTAPQEEKDKDALAMQAAEAADLQGKFWEMHDLLFEKQAEWSNLSVSEFETWIVLQAADLGMDKGKFKTDLNGEVVMSRLEQARQSAANESIKLPALFLNESTPYTGLVDIASLDEVVRIEALTARQFSACPDWIIDPLNQYIATMRTSKGNVVIQLYADKAPLAVNNFVFLARTGWYDGNTFYRVVPNFIAQTGDPSQTGKGNPGYYFTTEIPADLNFNQPGVVAMENSGENTNGSRFFITLGPTPQLEGHYTVIGKVLSGMDVLKSLSQRDPKPGVFLAPGDELIQITIEER
jgi:cyclophilin family peptidyl-prolyl cis-trans isomerase/protein-disulfide isomerase